MQPLYAHALIRQNLAPHRVTVRRVQKGPPRQRAASELRSLQAARKMRSADGAGRPVYRDWTIPHHCRTECGADIGPGAWTSASYLVQFTDSTFLVDGSGASACPRIHPFGRSRERVL